jgi:hypothetical protein
MQHTVFYVTGFNDSWKHSFTPTGRCRAAGGGCGPIPSSPPNHRQTLQRRRFARNKISAPIRRDMEKGVANAQSENQGKVVKTAEKFSFGKLDMLDECQLCDGPLEGWALTWRIQSAA